MQIIQFLISSLKIKPLTSKKDTLSSNKEHKHDRLYLKKLLPFIVPHWRKGLFASSLLVFTSILSLVQPLFTKYILDDIIVSKDVKKLAVTIGILLIILIIEAVLSFLKQVTFFDFEQKVIFEIQNKLFNRVLRFPKSFFDNKQTGYLMSRLSGDVFRLKILFSNTAVEIFTSFLKLLGGIVILFALHWQLTLLSLIILPFFFLSVKFFGEKTRQLSRNMMEKSAQVSRNMQESISGMTLIKTFAAEKRETKKITGSLQESIQASIEQNTVNAFSQLVIGTVSSLGTLLVLGYGAREIILGRMTVGSFVAFNSYIAYLYGPSRFLATTNVFLQSAFAALERVFSIYDLLPEDEYDRNKQKVLRLHGPVVFDRVSFSYETGKPVLRTISFSAEPGEKVALVGPTGAGKSTLVNLILRLYKPTSGAILFDGTAADHLHTRSLRERIGIVSQEIFLFDDTILNNIRYGKPEAADEEVIRFARLSQAHEFILQLPQGYQTKTGERGVKLSTGQKQRISIARALLKNPDILIFDEPTSALDAITESAIKNLLFETTNGKTTFIIAHRLSTVISANKILVLDKGRIVQTGTHEELAQKEGLYQRMFAEQVLV